MRHAVTRLDDFDGRDCPTADVTMYAWHQSTLLSRHSLPWRHRIANSWQLWLAHLIVLILYIATVNSPQIFILYNYKRRSEKFGLEVIQSWLTREIAKAYIQCDVTFTIYCVAGITYLTRVWGYKSLYAPVPASLHWTHRGIPLRWAEKYTSWRRSFISSLYNWQRGPLQRRQTGNY